MDSYESVVHSGDKTSIAIVGMPASKVSDTLDALEVLYQAVQEEPAGDLASIPKRRWWQSSNTHVVLEVAVRQARIRTNLLKIARDQVRELAIAHAKALNDAKAHAAQVDFYKQYLELAAQLRELRNFFAEHYSSELERALVQNVNLLDLAKQIMLRNKAGS